MTDVDLDDLCRKLRSYYEGPKPKPIPPITDEAADAIESLRAERDQLRRQVQAFRQIARSKEEFKAAELNGMRKAATLCKENDADWAYDLIMQEIDDLEKE